MPNNQAAQSAAALSKNTGQVNNNTMTGSLFNQSNAGLPISKLIRVTKTGDKFTAVIEEEPPKQQGGRRKRTHRRVRHHSYKRTHRR